CEPEGQTTFGAKSHIFLAGGVGGSCPASCANRASNQSASAAARYCANQRAATCSASDPCEVAFLMRGASHHHARTLDRNGFAVDWHRGQRDPQISRMSQSA